MINVRTIDAKVISINPTTGVMLQWVKIAGLESEESDLPDNVCTGSEFFEVDTGKTLYFDEDSGDWLDPTAEDDGGGSGG